MFLAPNFHLEEFLVSQTADRRGIDNTNPPKEVVKNLEQTAALLQQLRDKIQKPITILSGWRCPELNKAVGGSSTSEHLQGKAADIICPSFGSAKQLAEFIRDSGLPFGQLIFEGTWVHLGTTPQAKSINRVLTAVFKPGQKTEYIAGIK